MARIKIDPGAGFCFGVEEVIQTAESLLRKGDRIYGLGQLVHNSREISRLGRLGLQTISHEELPGMGSGKVLLRAHGEPPSTFRLAAAHHVELIDGTCPIVKKLQQRIRRAYNEMDHRKEQLVIFGKPDHPETIGLLGQVDGDAVVVSSMDDIDRVDTGKSVRLFSQTTMDPDEFKRVEEALKAHVDEPSRNAFQSRCTICGQMKMRKPGLRTFAHSVDVVVFVSGKNSSNGKMLYEFCRTENPRTHWISDPGEMDPGWFEHAEIIGISGATSTSRMQLEEVGRALKKFISS